MALAFSRGSDRVAWNLDAFMKGSTVGGADIRTPFVALPSADPAAYASAGLMNPDVSSLWFSFVRYSSAGLLEPELATYEGGFVSAFSTVVW